MNTVLKRFMVIGLVATLLASPFISSTTASAAQIDYFLREDSILYVKYKENQPYVIEKGNTGPLMNLGNYGRFNVAAGKSITFVFTNVQPASYKYSIINANTGAVIDTGSYIDSYGEFVISSPVPETGEYVILLTPTDVAALVITSYNVCSDW